jgi:anti-sigma factor RsiW
MLDAHLEGTLRPHDARAVAIHLRECSPCGELLAELRVVDALLTTARPPDVTEDITDAIVSATAAATPHAPRRLSVWIALALYVAAAWALAAIAIARFPDLVQLSGAMLASAQNGFTAVDAAIRALAPGAPLAAAAVTTILLLDLFLLGASLYAYLRLRPLLVTYLNRGERS